MLADTIEGRVQVGTQRTEKQTQAILAKEFRGELVPTEAELARQEARDYEPASVLLERIRAEREAQADKPKTRRPRKPKQTRPKPTTQDRESSGGHQARPGAPQPGRQPGRRHGVTGGQDPSDQEALE
jgi:hypothetical protein